MASATNLCSANRHRHQPSQGLLLKLILCVLLFGTSWTVLAKDLGHNSDTDGRTKRCDECVENARAMNRTIVENEQASIELAGGGAGINSTDAKTPIDWNEVEENFNKVLSEDEVFHKWDTMEANMKSGIRALLRTIFPKVVSLSSDAKVSGNCSAGILKWIVSLRHMKSWALKMLDAIGKPPSGIFEGVVSMLGNYDQCLKLRVFHDDEESGDTLFGDPEEPKEFFRGQYCVAEFKPWLSKKPRFYGMNTVLKSPFNEEDSAFNEFTKMAVFFHFISFRMDLCVPSTCTKEDIQRVANLMANLAEFRARVLRCEVDNGERIWTANFFLISLVIGLLVAVSLVATLRDFDIIKNAWLQTKFLTIFSIRNSWKRLNAITHTDHSNLNALYGVRVLILLWIIAVHTFIIVDFQYFREMQMLKTWATKWPTQIFTNSLFQFDCLILVSAFTFGYLNIDNSSSTRLVFKYLFKRYLRIAVLVMAMIFAILALPFLIPRGPLTQDFLAKQTQSCQIHGWRNLLFVQNFFHTECLPATWIFCVELQLMLLASLLFAFYHKYSENELSKKLFWLALPLLILCGFAYNFVQVYLNKLPPTYYWTLPDKEQRNEYFDNYFHKPWAHLSVFAIGLYAGVYRKLSNSLEKSIIADQSATCFGYFLSILTIMTFTFGFHDWIIGELPNEYISAIFNSCQNVCLALAYSWILFAITHSSKHNCNFTITRLLSGKLARFAGKLTITAYLSLPLVQTVLLSSQQQHLYSSTLLMVYVMLGNVIFTYAFALVLSLWVEIPTLQAVQPALNYLFDNHKSSSQEEKVHVPEIKSDPAENSLALPPSSQTASSYRTDIELSLCKEKL